MGLLERARLERDTTLGGFFTFTDDEHKLGTYLEVEVLLSDGKRAVLIAQVVWADSLPEGAPARFDVGLRLLAANRKDVERVAQVLDTVPAGQATAPSRRLGLALSPSARLL